MLFILCHKCSGLLASDQEGQVELLPCQCASGYVRGFEPLLSFDQALAEQIIAQERWLDLYVKQGRSETETSKVVERWYKLLEIQEERKA